jgi:hypothetical protein
VDIKGRADGQHPLKSNCPKELSPEQEKGSTLLGSGAPFVCCEGGRAQQKETKRTEADLAEGNKGNEDGANGSHGTNENREKGD